jgi:hypothetical protein
MLGVFIWKNIIKHGGALRVTFKPFCSEITSIKSNWNCKKRLTKITPKALLNFL